MVNTVIGTPLADVITPLAADPLKTTDGDDLVFALDGDDTIDTGDGNDVAMGMNGNDTISGGAGKKIFVGGDGDDSLSGGAEGDVLIGDGLGGFDPPDFFCATSGNGNPDLPFGQFMKCVAEFFGVKGREKKELADQLAPIFLDSNGDALPAAGNDTIFGGEGDDAIFGGANADHSNQSNFDLLSGEGGDDFISGGDGMDFIFGGDGNDTLFGDDGDDVIVGDADSDSLFGGAGFDILSGVDGGAADILDGGADRDIAYYFTATTGQVVDMADHTNLATNSGEHVNDIWIDIEGFYGARDFSNTITGDARDNDLFGGNQADVISGGAGVDLLLGLRGNDVLNGGTGDDVLIGGRGTDTVTGDAGADFFYIHSNSNIDIVTDWNEAEDSFLFFRTGASRFEDLTFTEVGDDVHITSALDSGFTVVVQNAELTDLDSDANYTFV